MNLFSGFLAMLKATEGEYVTAAWLIVLAAIFDGLDGAMARLTKSSSEFGVELDSLADVVSFGVAPSFLIYFAFFKEWETAGMVLAALPAICGALRLARFNVQLVGFDKDYFMGLPIPSAALTLISYLVFHHIATGGLLPLGDATAQTRGILMTTVTVGVSLLMVSTIRYDTLPKPSPRAVKKAPLKYLGLLTAIIVAAVTRGEAIFPMMVLYLVFGIIRQIIHWWRHEPEYDEDTLEEADPSPFDI